MSEIPDAERKKPREPFAVQQKPKPIVANPSVPGVQTPNKPDGRDAPIANHEKCGAK